MFLTSFWTSSIAKTMQMKVVQTVLDRMLMGYGIHLSPHIGENPELSHFLLDPDENLTWTSDSETILSLCSFVIQYKPSKLPANFWRKRCPYLPSMCFAPVKALWSPGGGTKPLPDQLAHY
ncbi:uncharacterized protein AAG666_007378 isoform 1-T1 [Megaptera novaeangliae]